MEERSLTEVLKVAVVDAAVVRGCVRIRCPEEELSYEDVYKNV